MNITKINNGYVWNERDYLFQDFTDENDNVVAYEVISESQVHIGTNDGIMLLDLSVTIDWQSFTDINTFVNFLYS